MDNEAIAAEAAKITQELEAIKAAIIPLFTKHSKWMEPLLVALVHDQTGRPFRYCQMYVSRLSFQEIYAQCSILTGEAFERHEASLQGE